MFKLDELKLMKGQPKVYITKGNSGADVERFFCANCGSTLYTVAPKVANPSPAEISGHGLIVGGIGVCQDRGF
jgi:hypothetical protein